MSIESRGQDHTEEADPPNAEQKQAPWLPVLSRGPAVRFAVTFGLLSAVLLGFYYFPYSDESPVKPWLDGFLHQYAVSAGLVLRVFEPQIRVIDQNIVGRYSLHIVKTCDAMDVTILLTSAIIAWPGSWKRRAVGAAAAVLLLYVLNVLRICSLYWIGIAFPSFFEAAHVDLWPALILLVSVGFFFVVTSWGPKISTESPREPV
jgi:exosortase/archaeosortase family protein